MQSKASRTGLLLSVGLACITGASAVVVACATEASQPSGLLEPDASAEGGGDGSSSGSASSSGGTSSSGGGSSSGTTSSSGGGCNANLQTDPLNCGSCNYACTKGDICAGGQCQAPCVSPKVSCPTQTGCFDLTSDPDNCGGCNTVCTAPAGGTITPVITCQASQCNYSCPADAGPADGGPIVQCDIDSGATGGCFDLTSTSTHCGTCSTQCPTGDICSNSQCCPTGQSYCGTQCIDTQSDLNNCGSCGAVCNAQCVAGQCVGYTTSNPTVAFIDACTQTGSSTKLINQEFWTATAAISLPFSFTFFGTAATQVALQSQGTMGVGPAGFPPAEGYPDCTESGGPGYTYPAIVAFGDEELATGTLGVCYATVGNSPNQQFVATWKQATDETDPGSILTFSIVLTQTTNTVDLMYETATGADGGADSIASGITATVGIQGTVSGKFAYSAYSCAKAFIPSTPYDIRFTPAN
ncbi:MAG TPA: hypothetical protein VGG39_13465 [Polyangiaceae bacterium]|jgi:hypothetical protein